jgi:Zn-dependent alcohol dehydrogenase
VHASGLSREGVISAVADLTGGGPEIAVDAVGAPATIAQAFASVRPGGTVVAVGLTAVGATVPVPVNELVQQQKRLVGSLYGSANPPVDVPRLLALHAAGRLPLDLLIGATYPLEAVPAAYDDLRAGALGRAVIVPRLAEAA